MDLAAAQTPDALAAWHAERSAACVLIATNWQDAAKSAKGKRRDDLLQCGLAAATEGLAHATAAQTIRHLRSPVINDTPFGRRLAEIAADAIARMRPGVAAQFVCLGETIAAPERI